MPRPPKNKAIEPPKPVAPAPPAPAPVMIPVIPAPPTSKVGPVIDVDNFIRVRDSVSSLFFRISPQNSPPPLQSSASCLNIPAWSCTCPPVNSIAMAAGPGSATANRLCLQWAMSIPSSSHCDTHLASHLTHTFTSKSPVATRLHLLTLPGLPTSVDNPGFDQELLPGLSPPDQPASR